MPFSFFRFLDDVRESLGSLPVETEVPFSPGFPIHPSASELAEEMLVDPEVLKNETYEPGIYDEDGDYYPQYSDDPNSLPEYFAPNDLGGDTVPESLPVDNLSSSENADSSKESNPQT